ncbi:DUF6578 domain-containing protein [Rhodococcus sp. ARC_M6]|uniref:DUF6578 domain-containing protein n=1 Tax=Rhodococcus sp. ARC_M6 TaxID=2928852 RepID=UPI001FB207D7|nr:DUF6578 domain-containing protein [Rhodococcus sp. ARC_M6]MCJ0904019.1 hypothetical protein [Rhodococcus sp. ARC_M6]
MHNFTESTPVDSSVKIIIVHIETWEFECCAPLPIVGEQSAWMLSPVAGSTWYSGSRHGYENIDVTAGTVLSIRLERGEFVEHGTGNWGQVPGSTDYVRVEMCPRHFRDTRSLVAGHRGWMEIAVVVELAITTTPCAPFR